MSWTHASAIRVVCLGQWVVKCELDRIQWTELNGFIPTHWTLDFSTSVMGWSQYQDTNPVSVSLLADFISTVSSSPVIISNMVCVGGVFIFGEEMTCTLHYSGSSESVLFIEIVQVSDKKSLQHFMT